jgi:hypothetical protein
MHATLLYVVGGLLETCSGEVVSGNTTRLLDSLGVTLVLQLFDGRSSVFERTTIDTHDIPNDACLGT